MSEYGIAAHIQAARPRVLAALTRAFRDLDFAEDALQEASARAISHWPKTGIPDDPAGWLIRTGRNAAIDEIRKNKRLEVLRAQPQVTGSVHPEDAIVEAIDQADMRDDILRLMFMCCHPQLGVTDQLALALKVIGGLSVAQIARAFVVTPKAMEQRITRAKKRAGDVATRLDTPTAMDRTERLDAVSTMVYLLFNEGYSSGGGDHQIRSALCDEAIRLTRLLLTLFPSQSELMGLLALCLLQHSRREARLDSDGHLVGLEKQDRTCWYGEEIAEGRVLIEKALRRGRPGPYQIQAAIAAVHCAAAKPEDTDWHEIEALYVALEAVNPSPIVSLNRAVAVSKTKGPAAALHLLKPLAADLDGYIYFHTTLADFLSQYGNDPAASAAYQRAMALGPTKAEAEFIAEKIDGLEAL